MRRRFNGSWMLRLAVAFVACGLLAGVASAQSTDRFVGSFTLPCQTTWDNAVLPAGDYVMTVNSVSRTSYLRIDSVNGKRHVYVSQWVTGDKLSDQNIIVLAVYGQQCEVRAVNLASLDMEISYKPLGRRQMALLRHGQRRQLVALVIKKR